MGTDFRRSEERILHGPSVSSYAILVRILTLKEVANFRVMRKGLKCVPAQIVPGTSDSVHATDSSL
jgi:hypothetical protein